MNITEKRQLEKVKRHEDKVKLSSEKKQGVSSDVVKKVVLTDAQKKDLVTRSKSAIPTVARQAKRMLANCIVMQAQLENQAAVNTAGLLKTGYSESNITITNYETALIQLNKHQDMLSSIDDIDEKIKAKQVMVDQYITFLNEYVDSQENYPNDVIVFLSIWLFDCYRIKEAFYFGEYAISQMQTSPFKSNLPTVFSRIVGNWAIEQHKNSVSAEPYLSQMVDLIESDGNYSDVEPIVIAILYKALGSYAYDDDNWDDAVRYFEIANDLNPPIKGVSGGAGVKTKLEKAVKNLEASTEPEPEPDPDPDPDPVE